MDDSQNVFEPGALSRRGFLKGSAVAAVSGGALVVSVACAPSSPAPKEGLAGTAGRHIGGRGYLDCCSMLGQLRRPLREPRARARRRSGAPGQRDFP